MDTKSVLAEVPWLDEHGPAELGHVWVPESGVVLCEEAVAARQLLTLRVCVCVFL